MVKKKTSLINVCYSVPTSKMGVATSGDEDELYDISVVTDAAGLLAIADHLRAAKREEGPVTLFFSNREEQEEEEENG